MTSSSPALLLRVVTFSVTLPSWFWPLVIGVVIGMVVMILFGVWVVSGEMRGFNV